MKKFYFFVPMMAMMLLASCTDSKVKQFAEEFATAVANNDTVSIEKMYPEAVKADSLSFVFDAEKAKVEKQEDGSYKVVLGDGQDIVVVKNEADGTFSVKESHGVFAFDKETKIICEALGCFDPTLSDCENADRMADTLFAKSIIGKIEQDFTKKVRVKDNYDGKFTVYNDYDFPISGNLYTIRAKSFFCSDCGPVPEKTHIIDGKDIAENSNVSMRVPGKGYAWECLTYDFYYSIELNVNDAETLLKLYKPSGNEYKEYLESKK